MSSAAFKTIGETRFHFGSAIGGVERNLPVFPEQPAKRGRFQVAVPYRLTYGDNTPDAAVLRCNSVFHSPAGELQQKRRYSKQNGRLELVYKLPLLRRLSRAAS